MNKLYATINRVLPFSCVDGPGNRLTLFLQGCNFHCKNCHNPYTIGHCNHCGECLADCPSQALTKVKDKVHWQANDCIHCDQCLNVCPVSASPMTLRYDVAQLIVLVKRYAPFLTGVTVSGGEATLQYKFIVAFFSAIKSDPQLSHLTCFVDSNGGVPSTVWEKLLPVMDAAMIDLKAWESNCHQLITGQGNHQVLKSLIYLAQQQKLYEVRLLLIPEQTDFIQHIEALSDFLIGLGQHLRVKINAFQQHGVTDTTALRWKKATQQQVEQLEQLLRQRGLQQIVTPSVYI